MGYARRYLAVFAIGSVALGITLVAQRPAPPVRDTPVRASATGNSGIHGRVTDIGTSRPLAKARVTLSSDNGSDIPPVFTDTNGEFSFMQLGAGHYTVVVEKTGYARLRYGARTALDPPIEIETPGVLPVENIEVRLTKGGAIYGRITDDMGDPIVGGEVSLMAVQMVGSAVRLTPVARPAAETNDLGDYRIGDLPPGRYYVSLAGAGLGTLPSGVQREWERLSAWARTLYPGTTSTLEAAPVTVSPGEERGGVDFSVKPYERTRLGLSLSGIVPPGVGAQGNTVFIAPATGAQSYPGGEPVWITFLPADPDAPSAGNSTITVVAGDSSLMLPNTPVAQPGEWVVFARQRAVGGAVGHVNLGSGDDQILSLTLQPGAKVRGRVVFEGARVPPLSSVQVKALGAGPDVALPADIVHPVPEKLKADGSFEIPDLFGTVRLGPVVPAGWTLKAITLGTRDLLDDPLTLQSGEMISGVQIVLSDRVGSLSGLATLPDGTTAGGCTVALFPDEAGVRFSSRRMRLVRADQHGRYRVRDLPSGAYRVAGGFDIDASSWLTQESIDALRARSKPVAVADRAQQTATVTCAVPQ